MNEGHFRGSSASNGLDPPWITLGFGYTLVPKIKRVVNFN